MNWEDSHPFGVSRSLKPGHTLGCFPRKGWRTPALTLLKVWLQDLWDMWPLFLSAHPTLCICYYGAHSISLCSHSSGCLQPLSPLLLLFSPTYIPSLFLVYILLFCPPSCCPGLLHCLFLFAFSLQVLLILLICLTHGLCTIFTPSLLSLKPISPQP